MGVAGPSGRCCSATSRVRFQGGALLTIMAISVAYAAAAAVPPPPTASAYTEERVEGLGMCMSMGRNLTDVDPTELDSQYPTVTVGCVAVAAVVQRLGIPTDDVAAAAGVGCSSSLGVSEAQLRSLDAQFGVPLSPLRRGNAEQQKQQLAAWCASLCSAMAPSGDDGGAAAATVWRESCYCLPASVAAAPPPLRTSTCCASGSSSNDTLLVGAP